MMQSRNKLYDETEILFARCCLKELDNETILSEEEEEAFEDRADELIREFGWPQVFECWNDYLRTNCHTAEEVLNFAHLFWEYEGYVHPIPDPYDFLAWFYYCIDMDQYADEAVTIMDSLSIEILSRVGVPGVDYVGNPYYVPEKDPKMLAAIQKIKDKDK